MRFISVILTGIVILTLATWGFLTGAQASVVTHAKAQQVCDPIVNSIAPMYNNEGYPVVSNLGSTTNWCLIPAHAGWVELQQDGTNNCAYANPIGTDDADLYMHVCNPGRDADNWKVTGGGDGGMANQYVSGYCASGYPLNNNINMYTCNGTGPEQWLVTE
jgi:hypothetical protein